MRNDNTKDTYCTPPLYDNSMWVYPLLANDSGTERITEK
jgi:hypothetical protein